MFFPREVAMKKLNLSILLLISSFFLLSAQGSGADRYREGLERMKSMKSRSAAEERAKLVQKLAARALSAREQATDSKVKPQAARVLRQLVTQLGQDPHGRFRQPPVGKRARIGPPAAKRKTLHFNSLCLLLLTPHASLPNTPSPARPAADRASQSTRSIPPPQSRVHLQPRSPSAACTPPF